MLEGIESACKYFIAVLFLAPVHELDDLLLPLSNREFTLTSFDPIKLLNVPAEDLERGV